MLEAGWIDKATLCEGVGPVGSRVPLTKAN